MCVCVCVCVCAGGSGVDFNHLIAKIAKMCLVTVIPICVCVREIGGGLFFSLLFIFL